MTAQRTFPLQSICRLVFVDQFLDGGMEQVIGVADVPYLIASDLMLWEDQQPYEIPRYPILPAQVVMVRNGAVVIPELFIVVFFRYALMLPEQIQLGAVQRLQFEKYFDLASPPEHIVDHLPFPAFVDVRMRHRVGDL